MLPQCCDSEGRGVTWCCATDAAGRAACCGPVTPFPTRARPTAAGSVSRRFAVRRRHCAGRRLPVRGDRASGWLCRAGGGPWTGRHHTPKHVQPGPGRVRTSRLQYSPTGRIVHDPPPTAAPAENPRGEERTRAVRGLHNLRPGRVYRFGSGEPGHARVGPPAPRRSGSENATAATAAPTLHTYPLWFCPPTGPRARRPATA